MSGRGRGRIAAVGLAAALGIVALGTGAARADGLAADPFARQVHGRWEGTGEYDGNTLALARNWTLELDDAFLRADMRVHMPNGASFGALMYWKRTAPDRYEVMWMDGIGRMQRLRAERDPASGRVSSTFLDPFTEHGEEWRIWEFVPKGNAGYEERLWRIADGKREPLATFRFERALD